MSSPLPPANTSGKMGRCGLARLRRSSAPAKPALVATSDRRMPPSRPSSRSSNYDHSPTRAASKNGSKAASSRKRLSFFRSRRHQEEDEAETENFLTIPEPAPEKVTDHDDEDRINSHVAQSSFEPKGARSTSKDCQTPEIVVSRAQPHASRLPRHAPTTALSERPPIQGSTSYLVRRSSAKAKTSRPTVSDPTSRKTSGGRFAKPVSAEQLEARLRVQQSHDSKLATSAAANEARIAHPQSSESLKTNPYDLTPPPPPPPKASSVEDLIPQLFSFEHMDVILRSPLHLSRFQGFLAGWRPDLEILLKRYHIMRKALGAAEYANSLSALLASESDVAFIDKKFRAATEEAAALLVDQALPAYCTARLVSTVSEILGREITGRGLPIMRSLVKGLAEVYCLTDPSYPDNPVIHASEEFFNLTQYGHSYSLGRNCRFLQGPHTQKDTVGRIREALDDRQETCELVLNYRRDGSPFINLLMIAPLVDDTGRVRYFLGAQVDITLLVQEGRGLETFAELVNSQSRPTSKHPSLSPGTSLNNLASLWQSDEFNTLEKAQHRADRHSNLSSRDGLRQSQRGGTQSRIVLGMCDTSSSPHPSDDLAMAGRLPGVFQHYTDMLLRPSPSLRITFTSSSLRIPGILQSKFMEHVGGTAAIREGISSALEQGIGVTAKIDWLVAHDSDMDEDASTQSPRSYGVQCRMARLKQEEISTEESAEGSSRLRPLNSHPLGDGFSNSTTARQSREIRSEPRYIHCTPLIDSSGFVGAWMVLLVDASHDGSVEIRRHDEPIVATQPPRPAQRNFAYRETLRSHTGNIDQHTSLQVIPPQQVPQDDSIDTPRSRRGHRGHESPLSPRNASSSRDRQRQPSQHRERSITRRSATNSLKEASLRKQTSDYFSSAASEPGEAAANGVAKLPPLPQGEEASDFTKMLEEAAMCDEPRSARSQARDSGISTRTKVDRYTASKSPLRSNSRRDFDQQGFDAVRIAAMRSHNMRPHGLPLDAISSGGTEDELVV